MGKPSPLMGEGWAGVTSVVELYGKRHPTPAPPHRGEGTWVDAAPPHR
jgi:hypothetical protein